MSSLQSIDIFGFNSGVQKNTKPVFIAQDAFVDLQNCYVWREQLKKREGLQLIGRYRRSFVASSLGNSTAGNWQFNIYSTVTPAITEPNAEIEHGSVQITIGAIVLIDQGNGILETSPISVGNYGYLDYITGDVVINHTAGAVASTINFSYYPALPAMGISTREIATINNEQNLWFDEKYCYVHDGNNFNEFLGLNAKTWNGTDSDFFWGTNYRGVNAQDRLFFETNFICDNNNPMRYTDGNTWTDFAPQISATGGNQYLFSARIIIPYYGRLLAFNTWEGVDRATAVNIFNRCRFSQIGSPVEAEAWRSDEFGRGGFIDAPTNEEIICATFFKNVLIVDFERSTWKLQYLGEYGLPFIWERISSDFGSGSTFSAVLFDSGVLKVGDKAITGSSGGDVQRIDLQIPDQVFDFRLLDNGNIRVQGIRDFKKELVFWCYPEFTSLYPDQYYPNRSLVYNYRNNTFSYFRNNVTCFGNFQYPSNVTWDRTDIFWDDETVNWDNTGQKLAPVIVSANQQGFAHFFGYEDGEDISDSTIQALDQESLAITEFNVVGGVITLTVPNHNLVTNEFIYITGMIFLQVPGNPLNHALAGSTTLNNKIYITTYVDKDTIEISIWDYVNNHPVSNFPYTNVGTYIGGGVLALFPQLRVETKDFNPMKEQSGFNIKTSFIDFLFDASTPSPINVLMQMNTTPNADGNLTQANLLIGNVAVETANSKTGFIIDIVKDVSDPTIVYITCIQHGLLTGDQVLFQDIVGSTQLNGLFYNITFVSVNVFSVIQSSPTISNYISGGYWTQSNQEYFTLSSQYSWHRFFASCFGQYLRIILTYDFGQMSQLSTHQQNFVLNAMKIWYRPGGRNIFGK